MMVNEESLGFGLLIEQKLQKLWCEIVTFNSWTEVVINWYIVKADLFMIKINISCSPHEHVG